MGCGASAKPEQKPVEAPATTNEGLANPAAAAAPPAKGKGKGKGKGKAAKGKGKGQGMKFSEIMKGHWQIILSGEWKDYREEEDQILKRAYLIGQPGAKFSLRGQDYQYDFKEMVQKNLGSGKERKIRPPKGMVPPAKPVVPQGSVVVVTVPPGGKTSIEIPDPNNPGNMITVAIAPGAKPGAKMVVPVPEKGESIEEVVKRQKDHSLSTGSKVAIGAAAVGALAVGGIVLGEHLSGGAVSEWAMPAADAAGDWVGAAGADVGDWAAGAAGDAGDWAAGAAGDAGDWATGAAGDAGDWAAGAAGDVGGWVDGAAGDVGDWAGDAAADVGDFAGDAAEDVVDWGAGAAEDVGDFVMSMF